MSVLETDDALTIGAEDKETGDRWKGQVCPPSICLHSFHIHGGDFAYKALINKEPLHIQH